MSRRLGLATRAASAFWKVVSLPLKLGPFIGLFGGIAGLWGAYEARKAATRTTRIEVQRLLSKTFDELGGHEGPGSRPPVPTMRETATLGSLV